MTELDDSVKFGVYTSGFARSHSPQKVRLQADGTFQIAFEDTITYRSGKVEIARATWTSTWKRVDDVFVVSREEDQFFAEGEGLRNAGWIDLDFHPVTMDSLEIRDVASGIRKVADQIDTSHVKLLNNQFDTDEKFLFLLPSDKIRLRRPGPDHNYTYNFDTFRHNFTKPYPNSSPDSTDKGDEG